MTLLTPLTGLIAALIVVPLLVVLYMLKLRRTRRDISSTLLWKSHTEDVRANSLMQRLRLSPLFLLHGGGPGTSGEGWREVMDLLAPHHRGQYLCRHSRPWRLPF